jgi:hypothetical protein
MTDKDGSILTVLSCNSGTKRPAELLGNPYLRKRHLR